MDCGEEADGRYPLFVCSSTPVLIQPVLRCYDIAVYLVVVANHTLVKRKAGGGCSSRPTQKEKRNSLKDIHRGPNNGSVAAV
jgi:hypothetical protein